MQIVGFLMQRLNLKTVCEFMSALRPVSVNMLIKLSSDILNFFTHNVHAHMTRMPDPEDRTFFCISHESHFKRIHVAETDV